MKKDQVLRTIGVIGDIHCEDKYLEVALKFLVTAHLDKLMCVGDIVDGPGDINLCCQLLQEYNVLTVRGNHDRWLLAKERRDFPGITGLTCMDDLAVSTYNFLNNLPLTLSFETNLGRLLLCHGLGTDDMGSIQPDDYGYALEANLSLNRLIRDNQYRFVINGHTHKRMVKQIKHLTIINAGTLFHVHQPCFLIVDFEIGYAQFFDLSNSLTIVQGQPIFLS